jgi:hypothetical protein
MPENWREDAMAIYRHGWLFIEPFKDDPRDDVQYFVEEMKEALLDLKQAPHRGRLESSG